jgi:hypothetical protein
MIAARVKPSEDGPKASLYQVKGKKTWLDWNRFFGWLVSEEKMDPSKAESEIEAIYIKAGTKKTEDPNVYIPELSDGMKGLFYYFRWYADIDGAISYYIKMAGDKETYALTKDPMKGAAAVEWANGQTLEELMRKHYLKLAREKKVDFLFADDGTVDNTEGNTKVLPTISEYWSKFIKNIWESDTAFRLPERPVEISTDPEQPAFFFFDRSVLQEGPHPVWDEWLSRMPTYSREVFMAWIYSIFDPANIGRQCVWLQDRGYSGKSSVARALSKFMGERCVGAVSHGSLSNQFGYSTVYGRRLVIYGDNKNPKLLHLEKMHSLLGGDIVNIEHKGRDAFAAAIHCKVLIASNTPPEIELSARNEITRLLYFKLSDPPVEVMKKYCKLDDNGDIMYYPDGTPHFIGGKLSEELLAELPAFLHTCRKHYERLCPNHMDIPMTKEMYRDLFLRCASPEHTMLEQFMEDKLVIGPEESCKKSELLTCYQKYKKNKANSFDVSRLIGYLESMFDVDQHMDEKGSRFITGCGLSAGGAGNYKDNKKPGLGSNV